MYFHQTYIREKKSEGKQRGGGKKYKNSVKTILQGKNFWI